VQRPRVAADAVRARLPVHGAPVTVKLNIMPL
jgi:hypothetical protein